MQVEGRRQALLSEIKDAAEDPSYWEEVMQAVPCEGGAGLSVSEVAEARAEWHTDCLKLIRADVWPTC